jgi:hypothetical protein
MSEYKYDTATKITIRLDVPNQRGGCGECNGIQMIICNKCSEEIGIVNSEIHNGQMNSHGRILKALEANKQKILNMVFRKK